MRWFDGVLEIRDFTVFSIILGECSRFSGYIASIGV